MVYQYKQGILITQNNVWISPFSFICAFFGGLFLSLVSVGGVAGKGQGGRGVGGDVKMVMKR